MKTFNFHKMHGLGNDFIIVADWPTEKFLQPAEIAALADRYRGIGFDQLLLLGPSTQADVDCRIFNADGSEAEQCGNGMRCVARFMHEEKRVNKRELTIHTKAGLIPVEIQDYDHIRVNMGIPKLNPTPVKMRLETSTIELTTLSLGNPHAILRVEAIDSVPLTPWANQISTHAAFPQGVNIGFMQILDRHHILLRTHERGSGETRACGSNACAAVIAGILNGWLTSPTTVQLPHGTLQIEWPGPTHLVHQTGPASNVFTGTIKQ